MVCGSFCFPRNWFEMIISEHKQASVNRKETSWETFLGYYYLVLLIMITLGSIVLTPWLTLYINGNNKLASSNFFQITNSRKLKYSTLPSHRSPLSFSIPWPTMHCDRLWQRWRINLSHARCFSTNFTSKTPSTSTAYQPPPTDNRNVTFSSRLSSPLAGGKLKILKLTKDSIGFMN